MDRKKQANNLIFWGFALFLLGLLVGFFIPFFSNPRMALSSHLEGVMNGMFLVLIGLVWNKIELSTKWLSITFWLAIYGTFANWTGILIAAVFNGGKDLTVAANGQESTPAIEAIIMFLLISLSLAMVIICITILIGLKRKMAMEN